MESHVKWNGRRRFLNGNDFQPIVYCFRTNCLSLAATTNNDSLSTINIIYYLYSLHSSASDSWLIQSYTQLCGCVDGHWTLLVEKSTGKLENDANVTVQLTPSPPPPSPPPPKVSACIIIWKCCEREREWDTVRNTRKGRKDSNAAVGRMFHRRKCWFIFVFHILCAAV